MTQPLAILDRPWPRSPRWHAAAPDESGPTEVRAAASPSIASPRGSKAPWKADADRGRRRPDLRTPLTRMRLRAEFLEDERDQWLADLSELDRIADSAIRLVREEVEDAGSEAIELHTLANDLTRNCNRPALNATLLRADPVTVLGQPSPSSARCAT